MWLFTLVWQSTNKEKVLKAVAKESRQAILVEITKKSPFYDARIAAVKKLTDPNALSDELKMSALGMFFLKMLGRGRFMF